MRTCNCCGNCVRRNCANVSKPSYLDSHLQSMYYNDISSCFMNNATASDDLQCKEMCVKANTKCNTKIDCNDYCDVHHGPYDPDDRPKPGDGNAEHDPNAMADFVHCVEKKKMRPGGCADVHDMHDLYNCDKSGGTWAHNFCVAYGAWPDCNDDGCQVNFHDNLIPVGPKVKPHPDHPIHKKDGKDDKDGKKKNGGGDAQNSGFFDSTGGKVTIGVSVFIIIAFIIILTIQLTRNK